jgi:hypothetical protein
MSSRRDAWVAIYDGACVRGVSSSEEKAMTAAWLDVWPDMAWVEASMRHNPLGTPLGALKGYLPPGYRVMRMSEWREVGQLELECALSS